MRKNKWSNMMMKKKNICWIRMEKNTNTKRKGKSTNTKRENRSTNTKREKRSTNIIMEEKSTKTTREMKNTKILTKNNTIKDRNIVPRFKVTMNNIQFSNKKLKDSLMTKTIRKKAKI